MQITNQEDRVLCGDGKMWYHAVVGHIPVCPPEGSGGGKTDEDS